jgi:hypothetical protein
MDDKFGSALSYFNAIGQIVTGAIDVVDLIEYKTFWSSQIK